MPKPQKADAEGQAALDHFAQNVGSSSYAVQLPRSSLVNEIKEVEWLSADRILSADILLPCRLHCILQLCCSNRTDPLSHEYTHYREGV